MNYLLIEFGVVTVWRCGPMLVHEKLLAPSSNSAMVVYKFVARHCKLHSTSIDQTSLMQSYRTRTIPHIRKIINSPSTLKPPTRNMAFFLPRVALNSPRGRVPIGSHDLA